MPTKCRPWLELLWEAAKQSGEEGFQAAQPMTCPRHGACDPTRREKTPSSLRESQRGLWWSWHLQIPRAWLPSPCFLFWSLPSASCSQAPYQMGATTRRQMRPPAVGGECLPPPKGLTDLSDMCKSSCGVFLDQSEHVCMLAVLCLWYYNATPTFTYPDPTLVRWKNEPRGIALPIAPQRQVLKTSFRKPSGMTGPLELSWT